MSIPWPCRSFCIPSERVVLCPPLFHFHLRHIWVVNLVVEICLPFGDGEVLRTEVDALRNCTTRLNVTFFAQFWALRIHWWAWPFLLFDFDRRQNVFIAVIFCRPCVWRAFSRVLVVCWWHEVVNFLWVVLWCSNLAWSEVSFSSTVGVYVTVVIWSIDRYIRRWAIHFIKANLGFPCFRSFLRLSSFIFLVNGPVWAIWTSPIWKFRSSFPYMFTILEISLETGITASASNWRMLKDRWSLWFSCRVWASWLTSTFIFDFLVFRAGTA